MAHWFSILFFVSAAFGAAALIAVLVKEEWGRVIAILAGEELAHARSIAARPVRVRMRSRRVPERPRAQPLRAAA